ncbi:nucleoside kinase [Clostridium sp. D33t1_170424_F3]|uniref:uridine kinase family protein n=1 Tax=Clostridium sp. D33t1_170424_F3 TaxID=2787099 RepID=UPI0018A923E8|nr:nucleoside kinase [Clostridium sp. D33t1_170424_F3]
MRNILNLGHNYFQVENELERINYRAAHCAPEFIAQTEMAFHRHIQAIAQRIAGMEQPCKVMMLAGPSSSGKTTTAHILLDALRECGIRSQVISLDNFYKGERQAPLLENGQHDYESVEALNVSLLEQCLLDLMETDACDMPVFDFEKRMPSPFTRRVQLSPREMVVVEGIHALNPAISQHLPEEGVLKAYISVKQGVDEQGEPLLTANQLRLIRRLLRDYHFRNNPLERTLDMWETVMAGEYKYIKPYRGEADVTINSLHCYEPCVMREEAIPLLRAVSQESVSGALAWELADRLERFVPIPQELVPESSLLREFIGGGRYSES